MVDKIDKHILRNGMILLGEPMDAVGSVAFSFMLPAGAAILASGCCGASNVIADWISRGAAGKSSKELCDALDGLGLHRASCVGSSHITVGAVLEAGNLHRALDLYGEIICSPNLEQDQFELAQHLAIDSVRALDDDPHQRVMLKLKEQFYPYPLGRSTLGSVEELQRLTAKRAKKIIQSYFDLSQTIFTVAGKYNFDEVCRQINSLFDLRQQGGFETPVTQAGPGRYTHINNDGAQVHIGLMTETVKPNDKSYYDARVAVSILSGGMSARLFTEVREKRGLCYAIGAGYHCLKQAAGIMCYAGTTPDKAQETIKVIIGQFNHLCEGINEEEINRAKAGLKSALILQSESTSSRAGAIGSDYYMLGRVRSLDEIKDSIEETTVDSVRQFLANNKFNDFTVVTVGPKQIDI